jgi:hypothetical protein
MKKSKQPVSVTVMYDGYDPARDAKIETAAKSIGGKLVGSGYGFGQRDIQFHFPTSEAADKAKKKFKAMKLEVA